MTTPRDRGAREVAHGIVCERQQSSWCHWLSNRDDHANYCDTLTAAIEARDAAHVAELAELRAKVIEECAQAIEGARILYDDIEDYNAQLAARIRALEVK